MSVVPKKYGYHPSLHDDHDKDLRKIYSHRPSSWPGPVDDHSDRPTSSPFVMAPASVPPPILSEWFQYRRPQFVPQAKQSGRKILSHAASGATLFIHLLVIHPWIHISKTVPPRTESPHMSALFPVSSLLHMSHYSLFYSLFRLPT